MHRLLSAAAALLCVVGFPAFAPTSALAQKTIVTATSLRMGGVLIPFGTVTITPKNFFGQPVAVGSTDFDLNGPQGFTAAIASGAIVGTFNVPDECSASSLSPNTPLVYQIDILNSAAKTVANPYGGQSFSLSSVQGVCGATWALDHYVPTQTSPSITGLSTGVTVPLHCSGASVFYTQASPSLRYSCKGNVYVLDSSAGSAVVTANSCPAGQYAAGIAASGVLTCSAVPQSAVQPDATKNGSVALAAVGDISLCPVAAAGVDIRCNTTSGLMCSANGAAYAACGSSSGGTTSNSSAPAATTTTLNASSTTPTSGTSVTFTATVASSAATGTVTFKDGSTTLGTGTLASGTATYSTAALTAGSHSITAVYGGNSSYATSTSSVVTVTVAAAQTGGGGSGIAFSQGCTANPCVLSGLTSSAVVIATHNGNASTATLSDSAGGTMPAEVAGWPKAENGGVWYQHLWAVPNVSGSHTYTVAYATEYYSLTVGSAFTGASTTAPLDASAYNASGYTPVCPAITPSAANEMIVSIVSGNSSPFSPANMTAGPNSGNAGIAYNSAASASAFTPTWNMTGGAGDFGCTSLTVH